LSTNKQHTLSHKCFTYAQSCMRRHARSRANSSGLARACKHPPRASPLNPESFQLRFKEALNSSYCRGIPSVCVGKHWHTAHIAWSRRGYAETQQTRREARKNTHTLVRQVKGVREEKSEEGSLSVGVRSARGGGQETESPPEKGANFVREQSGERACVSRTGACACKG
jgi:hypothetical protein